jgi:hypothetical protein
VRKSAIVGVIFFALIGVLPSALTAQAQVIVTAPGAAAIPGIDERTTSAIVSNITVTVRQVTSSSNQPITKWNLTYNHYNGSYRWEYIQWLNITNYKLPLLVTINITIVSLRLLRLQPNVVTVQGLELA